MDPHDLTPLEREVVTTLLGHDQPAFDALREQAWACQVRDRELTGVGFHAHLVVRPDMRVSRLGDIALGDVSADIDGLEHGAGFLLWVKEGRLVTLEAFSFDEPWPHQIGTFKVWAEHPAGGTLTDLETVQARLSRP